MKEISKTGKPKYIQRHFKSGQGRELLSYEKSKQGDIVVKNARGLYRWLKDDEVGKLGHSFMYGVYRLLKDDGA